MRSAKAIGRRIRHEMEPEWDPVIEARVLRRVMTTPPARPSRRGPLAMALAMAAGLVLVLARMAGTQLSPGERVVPDTASMQAVPAPTPGGHATAAGESQSRPVDPLEPVLEPRVQADAPATAVAPAKPRPRDLSPSSSRARPKSERAVVDLLAQADAARQRGELVEATRLLRRVIAEHPKHRDIAAARMGLARVLEQRKRFGDAARAYEDCLRRPGPLHEDARAGAARSWVQHRRLPRARAHARAYLREHPQGLHADAMRALVEDASPP